MSNSRKKTNAHPICSARGDKACRAIYHRAERRKTHMALSAALYEEEPSVDQLPNCIDTSLPMADKWSWGSDGGAYYDCSKAYLYTEFNEWLNGKFLGRGYFRIRKKHYGEAYLDYLTYKYWYEWSEKHGNRTSRVRKQAWNGDWYWCKQGNPWHPNFGNWWIYGPAFRGGLFPTTLESEEEFIQFCLDHENKIVDMSWNARLRK